MTILGVYVRPYRLARDRRPSLGAVRAAGRVCGLRVDGRRRGVAVFRFAP